MSKRFGVKLQFKGGTPPWDLEKKKLKEQHTHAFPSESFQFTWKLLGFFCIYMEMKEVVSQSWKIHQKLQQNDSAFSYCFLLTDLFVELIFDRLLGPPAKLIFHGDVLEIP